MPVTSSLVCDEDFFSMRMSVKRAGLEGYEKTGKGVDVLLGPPSTAEMLEVACFGTHHLSSGEVNVLNDVL
jgi:hypothetical protein